MSKLSELIEEGKKHRVSLKNHKGKTLINISLSLRLNFFLPCLSAWRWR